MESLLKENSFTLPTTRQRSRKNHAESSSEGGVCGRAFGVLDSSVHESGPGVGVAETVDVGIKKDLVRAHVVALKDGGESVVLVGEALVTPVGDDRSSRSRECATRAACAAG
jgi:hypothetical protein